MFRLFADEHALGGDASTAVYVGVGNRQLVAVNFEVAQLIAVQETRNVATEHVNDPHTALGIHGIDSEIGAIPNGNAGVRVRIGSGACDVGWVAHDAERRMPAG